MRQFSNLQVSMQWFRGITYENWFTSWELSPSKTIILKVNKKELAINSYNILQYKSNNH